MSRRIAIVTALATLGLALVALTFIPPRATAQMDSTSGFVVDQTYDAIWGTVAPAAIVTAARGTAYGAAQADGIGFFWTPLWQSNGRPADITGTDTIQVYVNGSLSATITVSGVTGLVDVLNDRVVGKLGGVTAPTPVTVTLGTDPGVPSVSATTDASGRFTATFTTVDLSPDQNAVVEYRNGPHTLRALLAPSQVFRVSLGWNDVSGYAQPGQVVTATVYTGTSSLTKTVMTGQANKPQGYYDLKPSDDTVINGGDVVKVNLGGGVIISTTAVTITMYTNPTTNLVTGAAPAGARLRASLSQWTDDKNRYYQVTTTANATGIYTANFSGVADVQVYDWIGVAVADSKGNETQLWSGAPMISVDESKDSVWARVNGSNLAVTATLDTGSGTFAQTGTSGLQHFADLGRFPGNPDIQPGHHITVETVSWTGVITVANLRASLDTAGNRLLGDAPAGRAQAEIYHAWSDRYPAGLGGVIQQITVTSPFTLAYANFDVRDGDGIWLTSHDSNGFDTGRWFDSRVLQVNAPYGVGAPQFSPSEVLTATLYSSDGVTVKRQTSQDTEPDSTWYQMDLQGQIAVGDWVTLTDGAGWTAGVQVPNLTVQANAATDLIWGKGPKSLLLIQRNWDWQSARFVPCDDYKMDAAYFGEDLLSSDRIQTMYFALNGNRVVREFEFPWTRVNYGHDWVEANYEAGHTVWITLTNSGGTVKATAVLTTGAVPGWDGQTGFSTNWQGWNPSQPDIVPGDWVYVRVDDGYASTVRVGTITGNVSSASDSISGTITANWFTQTLNARCEVWMPSGPPGIDMTVNPNGGSYSCDFGTVGWDVLPGQDVAVLYSEPDRDQVINVFHEPTPHLRINKSADGNSGEGGNFVFRIQYWNDGDGPAENTIITDTMLGGMTYLTDTSGFPHTGSGSGPVVWNLGSVPASSWGSFDVFVHVTAVESETITDTVQIATGNPYDQGGAEEKESMWSGHVEANDTHLKVDKGAWTGDPVPGYDFVYSVNTCNNGSTASNLVTLTDTLHLSTTLKYWWAQHPGWTGVYSDAHTLVVSRPSAPGGWCGEVYLRVHLDENAWQGMSISNTAVISASNDLEGNDNESTWWGNVGNPHTNLGITQYWVEGGQVVVGGEFFYAINYNNDGNVPVSNVRITVTLPVSTTFSRAWRWTDYGDQPFTPTLATANYVVWDIGTLDNGYNDHFGLALRADSGASPGTVLTGTVEISPQPDEDRYDDNQATWVEVLNSSGPNLRVSKWYRWENQSRIRYGIWIQNVGTTRLENIWITDTYPLSTTSDGNFWVGHGPWYTHTLDALNRRFVVWAEALDPGSTGQFGFWVNLDGALHGVEGLVFTNTVEAPWPGDVYPADNRDVELAYTGPDVYVEKWLSGGKPGAGEIVTFTVEFGNRNQWPWDGDSGYGSHITDTLPAGMQFITATFPWRPNERWTPESIAGNTIVWGWGTMWKNWTWQFDVVARITNTVQIGQVFTNTVTARGDSPDDVEPYYQNNVVRATVALPEYRIYLPLVRKN